MADRRWQPSEDELADALSDLGPRIDYPSTPDLVGGVGTRLRAKSVAPVPSSHSRMRPLFALAAVVLLIVGLGLLPPVRTVVADRLGVRGIPISYLPWPVTPLPTPSPSAVPAASTSGLVGSSLGLGERLTLDEARSRVAFHVLTPILQSLGPPDEVYLIDPPSGGEVSLVYRARPGLPRAAETGVGLLLSEFRGDLAPDMIAAKGLGPRTRLEAITVNGGRGFWIEGESHYFFYRDPSGDLRDERVRLAANTLLWEQATLTLRLESALSRDEALRIAASLR